MTEPTDKSITENSEIIIPVIKETVVVDKLNRVTEIVDVDVSVDTKTVSMPVTLESTEYEERRIQRNIIIDEAPEIRYEGDAIIIPVFREEAVVVKKLILVEEIYLTKKTTTKEEKISVEVDEQSVSITRRKK